jgi:hypothetical protein
MQGDQVHVGLLAIESHWFSETAVTYVGALWDINVGGFCLRNWTNEKKRIYLQEPEYKKQYRET